MQKANRFRAIVFYKSGQVVRYNKVNNPDKLRVWLLNHSRDWKYLNVYEKATKAFVGRLYPSQSDNADPRRKNIFRR